MSGQDDQPQAAAPDGPAEPPGTADAGRGLPPILWVPGLIAITLLLLAIFGLN